MKKTITLFAFLTVLTIFPFLTAFSQCGCSSITFLGDPIPSGSDFTVSADICFGGNACPGGGAFGDSYGVIINFTGANVTAATPSITNPISSVTLNASGVGTNNIQYGNPFFPIIPPFHDAVLDGAQLCYTVSFTFDAYPSAWSGGGQEVGNCFGNNLFTPFCPDNAGTPSPAGPLTVCFNDASQTIDATGFTLHNTPNACIGWGLWVMNDPLGVYTGNPGVSGIGTPPSGGDPNSDPNFDGLIGTGTTLNIPALNNGVTYQICGLTLSDCVANPAQYDPTCFDVSNVCVEVFMNTQIQIVPIAINCDEDFCDDCLEYNVLIAGGDAEANGTTYSVDIDVNGTVTTVTGVNDGDIITIGNITNPGSVPVGAGTISITVTDAAGCTQTFSPSIPLDGDDYCGNTCGADAGTVTVTITGDTKDAGVYDGSIDPTSTVGPFILCFTDGLELMSNMDFTEPPTGPDPGMSYSINEGFPVAALLDQDPKWTGIFWTGELTITSDPYLNNTYQNTMHLIRTCFLNAKQFPYNGDPNDFPDNTIYYVPYVGDCTSCPNLDSNGDGCYDYNGAVGITYLNPIIAIGNQTCRGLELTFLGGYPEFYGGLYTIDLMSNGNPIAEDLTTGYGGKLLVEDLNYGESIGISVVDPQGCDQVLPIQTYIFQEPTVSFTAMDNAYCSQEAPVALTGNPLPGTAPPNVSYTVTIYRDTAPNQNSFEITDNTNTVVYSRSGSQISSYPSNPENKAVFNTGPLPASGCPYTFKINDSGGNGQAVCINNQATGGYIIYDNISGQFWPPTGPEIGNWGASDTWLLGCPPDHILTASFVGPGITDNTDGTATFNPNIAGPGIHTICYNLTYDGLCDFQSCQTIEVTAQPVINPINDITVCYPPGQLFNLTTIPLTGAFLGIATLEWLNDNSGSPGTPVANPTAVPTGTYWLRATTTATTDATETCVAVDQFSVIVSSTPVINPIPPQEDCEQFDLTTTPLIDANGLNYATAIITFYEDDGGGGLGAPATNPTTISGDYHVIVDFFGCADTAVFTVTVNPAPPAPIISGTLNVCLTNASTILDAGAGYATYQWSASNGGTISGATNMQTITATSAGDYTVIVTDANGCQNTATVTVGTFPDPGAVIIGSASFCLGQSTTLDAGAGWATYSWAATNGGNITTGTNSQTITVDASGTYTVTVTDAVTGCQDIASIDVTETTGLTPIIGGDLSICVSDGTTILDAGSGYATYTWAASGGGNISGGTNGQTITATTTGNYSVTVTDASGCSGSTTVAVTVSPNPTAAIIPTGSTYLCTGGNVNLTASGGGNYSWSPGGQSTASITVSTGGTYTVTVTDPVSGCTDVESVIATEINVQATAVAAAQNCTGTGTSIDVTPSGGTGGGYNFTWSDGSIGNVEDPTNLQYGQTYTVTVTDITTGCFIVASATTVAAPVQASIGTTTNATCNGANDGSITINVIGGKAPITYTWAGPENPGNTGNASGLNPGDYSVTVTDGDGCTVLLGPITITDPPLLTWSVPTDITICPGQSVVFSDYNGPSGGGTYSWYKNSFPPTGLLVIADNPSSNTTYYVVYTEGTCSEQTTVNLIIDAAPSFTITENPILACQGNNIIFSNYNGPEPGTFTWYDAPIPGGNIVTNITASTNATYYVLYDINGCTNTTSVDVQVTPLPTLTITPPSTLCSSSADGNSSINLDDWITASTPGTWSGTIPPGASGSFPNIDFDSVTPGVYSFTYTINAAPCSAVTGVINVSVINCQCPDVSVVPVLEVCGSVTQGLIDLTAEAQLTTEPGTWVVFDDNNATWPVQILPGAFLDATSATPGTYILHYELDNPDPDPNCPPFGETTVNVYAPPFAGTDATLDLCSNDNTTYNLINSIFDGDLGGTWSLDPSSDYNPGAAFTPATGELNPNGLAAGTLIFLYSVNPTDPLSPCLSDYALLTVNISLPGNAGTATPLTTCNTGASVVDLFAQLTGESAGGIWTVSSGSPGANFNAGAGTFNPNGLSGVFDFTYSLGANGVCPATSATVSITVNIAPSATITAPNQAMCNSSGYTPNSLNFTTLITAGDLTGTWTAITPGAPVGFPNVSFDGTTPGDFVYQYCTGIAVAPCTNPCYQITVSVVDCSCPIVASLSIPNQCNDNLNLDLDNYLAVGAAPGTWSLGITPPGSTAIINAATGVITGSGTPAGAYQVIYTLSSPKPGCPSSSSQSITLIQAPFAGNDNSQSYCTDIASVNLISLLPGANPLGTWALISGTADAGVFNAAAGTLNPSLQTTATTLVISYTVAGTSPCTDAVGSLTISIILAPEAGTGSTIDVCSNDNTIVNLGTLLTGEDLGGTWTLQSGSPIPGSFNAAAGTFNPAGQSGGAYVFQYEAVGCGLTDLETVTINITPAPDAGVGGSTTACNNDATPIDLTTLVTGYTPGGTWVSGSSFTPQGQAAGIYTFDYVLNDPNCGNDIATVTVEVFAQPQATVTNTATICNAVADGSVLNFNALVTAGATNGTWTAVTPGAPAVAGGTADFDGLTPGTYNYTYTLTGTAPCSNVTYAVAVIVENCACPSPTTSTPPVLCNDAATLDLSTLTLPTTDPGAWSIESQPGGGTASLVGNNFAATGSAAGNYVVRYTLVPPPLDPNCPPYTEQTITLNAPPNAGTNGSTTACNDQVAPLDLFALLGGTPQTGGNWTNNNGASNFNAALGNWTVLNHAAGTYTFTYTIIGTAPCPNASATVSITISAKPQVALTPPAISPCNTAPEGSTLDFNTLVTQGSGGIWTVVTPGAPAPDGAGIADFVGLAANSQWTYEYCLDDPSGTCTPTCQQITITVQNCLCPDLTITNPGNICNTAGTIDLAALKITPEAGTFTITNEPIGSSVSIAGNTLNISGTVAGSYTLTFTLTTPKAGCPDKIDLPFQIDATVNAGTPTDIDLCSTDSSLDLYGQLTAETAGGTWTVASGNPGANFNAGAGSLNPSGLNGAFSFTYTINSALGICPSANSTVNVNIALAQTASLSAGGDQVCNNTADGNAALNINSYLTGGSYTGGTWTTADAGPTTYPNLDFNGYAPGTYTYTYTIDNGAPCTDVLLDFEVIVQDCSCPDVSTTKPADACNDAASIDLNAYKLTAEAGTWTITNAPAGSTATITGGNNLNLNATPAGNYELTFTLTTPKAGCPDQSVQTITIQDAPTAGTAAATAVCVGDATPIQLNTLLTAEDAGGTWTLATGSPTPDAGTFNAGTGIFTAATNAAGDYAFTYTVTGIAPCAAATATVTVTIGSLAVPTAVVQSLATCAGTPNTAAFEAIPPAGATIYWYDINNQEVATGNTYVPTVAGTYTAIAKANCDSQPITFTLTEIPLPEAAIILSQPTICVGETATITADGISPTATYNWDAGSLGVFTGTGPHDLTPNNVGNYPISLTVTDNGCTAKANLSLDAGTVSIKTIADTSIYKGESLELITEATGAGLSFSWDDPLGFILDLFAQSPTIKPTQSGNYIVTATDENGCEATDEVFVTVLPPNDVIVPNAFSPNNDGTNDIFTVKGANIASVDMVVYDRWGILVFDMTNLLPGDGWNGQHNNKICEVGTYVFHAKVTYIDGKTKDVNGNITLLR